MLGNPCPKVLGCSVQAFQACLWAFPWLEGRPRMCLLRVQASFLCRLQEAQQPVSSLAFLHCLLSQALIPWLCGARLWQTAWLFPQHLSATCAPAESKPGLQSSVEDVPCKLEDSTLECSGADLGGNELWFSQRHYSPWHWIPPHSGMLTTVALERPTLLPEMPW